MNVTIFRKGLILIAVPLFFQLMLIGVLAEMERREAEANVRFVQTREVLTRVETIRGKLGDVEGSTRGYAIAQDGFFVQAHERAAQQLQSELEQLAQQVAAQPLQQVKIEAIRTKVARFLAFHADQLRVMRQAARDDPDWVLHSSKQMWELVADLADFRATQQQLDEKHSAILSQVRLGFRVLLIAGAFTAMGVTGSLAYFFSRGIADRLAVLVDNTQRFAEGRELTRPIAGVDEITEVDRAFRRMVATLAQSREQLQMYADIVHNVPIGLLIYRLDDTARGGLRLVDASPCASTLLGVDRQRIVGQAIQDAFPALDPGVIQTFREVGRTGQTKEVGEVHYGDHQVQANYWLVRAFALPKGQVGVAFENVTARKMAEEAIRQLNAELERRVEERTADLARTNRDLAQKNQENETFVYSVSHDLRSPLINLQGFSKELQLTCADLHTLLAEPDVPPPLRQRGEALLNGGIATSVRFIQTAVLRLSRIIDALLRLSRVGRVTYQQQPVDLAVVVTRIVDALQGTLQERGATVRIHALPTVPGDPTALEQVFANLIGNALHYLDPKRPGVVEVGQQPTENGMRVCYVKDNGVGIDPAHQPKLFQAFQRLHPNLAPGEGMGLKIVQRIVERHQGRIWVDSRVGAGSTFWVALPGELERLASPTPDS